MKIPIVLLVLFLTVVSLHAQEYIHRTSMAVEIDGFPDDAWETASSTNAVNKPFKTERPTVTATWQALYDNDYFYVLVNVEDDNHWPGWEANGDSWLYDKPEIYWDVNKVLDDGLGAGTGKGHYQFADGFTNGMYDIPITKEPSGNNPGGTYCYSLNGESYVYEYSVPIVNLKDENGISIIGGNDNYIGFDVTVIDQDEGITTARQRCVWSNDGNGNNGSTDESWNNMDGAGKIILSVVCCGDTVSNRLAKMAPAIRITPNPVSDCFSFQNNVDRVELYSVLGELVYESNVTDRSVSVAELSNGIYIVKAYLKDQIKGVAKIIKN